MCVRKWGLLPPASIKAYPESSHVGDRKSMTYPGQAAAKPNFNGPPLHDDANFKTKKGGRRPEVGGVWRAGKQ